MSSIPSFSSVPIGVIGLGLLGTAIAERLLAGGYSLVVQNRTRQKAVALEARGARWSDNPLVECDRVVICLYTTQVVEDVLERLDAGIRPGQVYIDTTTGDPSATAALGRRLATRGVDYLESPIAASSEQTRQGEAMALVAGPEAAFHACQDILGSLTSQAHYVGQWGNAAKMKLVNNLILGLNRAALAEALCFARGMDLDAATTLDVLRQGNAYSGVMDTKGHKMIEEDFTPQAKLSQHAKDVRLILAEARELGCKLPLSQLHLELLEQAQADGWGELDNSAIIRAFAKNSTRPNLAS